MVVESAHAPRKRQANDLYYGAFPIDTKNWFIPITGEPSPAVQPIVGLLSIVNKVLFLIQYFLQDLRNKD
jgi:hypothetical protein